MKLRGASRLLALLGLVVLAPVARGAPTVFPTGVTIHDPSKAFQGFNLLVDKVSNPPSKRAILLDMSGAEVRSWESPVAGYANFHSIEPLPNGNITALLLAPATGDSMVAELDPAGALVWQYLPPAGTHPLADTERLPNGNTLVLVRRQGLFPEISPNPFWDELVQEVDPSGEVVWEWSTAAHWPTLPLTVVQRNLIQKALMAGTGIVFHCNGIASLPPNPHEASDPRFAAGNILVSQRDTNAILLVERSTGDIVWFYYGSLGQHQVHMLDASLPGAGNLLMLDNGGSSGYPPVTRSWSQVIEVNPATKQVVWSYDALASGLRTEAAFFTPVMGGAQRLPNGNTLTVDAVWGRAFEVTTTGEIVWEYVQSERDMFRIARVGPSWPGAAGAHPRRDR